MLPVGRNFPPVSRCNSSGRGSHAVAADLDGTLLVSRSSFPYFMLLAVEAGSFLRGLALLLAAPLVLIIYRLVSEAAGIQLLIFVSLAGLPMSSIERVSATVLPRFYAADVREHSFLAFRACGRRRVVVTANPSVMVRSFVRECLSGNAVLGTELGVWRGRATGLVRSPGVLVGRRKAQALQREFAGDVLPELGLGDRDSDHDFMALCKEGYMVPHNPSAPKAPPHLLRPLYSTATHHRGAVLNIRPTPRNSLRLFLWLPLALLLAALRLTLLLLLPTPLLLRLSLLRIRTTPPKFRRPRPSLYAVSNLRHAPLAALLLSAALRRRVRPLQLSGDPAADAAAARKLLHEGDVAVCAEGSVLPEEVKVAVGTSGGVFLGVNKEGSGWAEVFYWMMNPRPECEVTFYQEEEEDVKRS